MLPSQAQVQAEMLPGVVLPGAGAVTLGYLLPHVFLEDTPFHLPYETVTFL